MSRNTVRVVHRNLPKQRPQPTVHCAPQRAQDQPPREFIRGRCPSCRRFLVSNVYPDKGLVWECWGSLMPEPTCDYRKVL